MKKTFRFAASPAAAFAAASFIVLGIAGVSCSKVENLSSESSESGDTARPTTDSYITFTARMASGDGSASPDGPSSAAEGPDTKVAINIYPGTSRGRVVFTEGDWMHMMGAAYDYSMQTRGIEYHDAVTLGEDNINSDGTATFSLYAPDSRIDEYCFIASDSNCFGLYGYAYYDATGNDDYLPTLDFHTRTDAFNVTAAGRIPHLAWAKCTPSDRTIEFKNLLTLIRYTVNTDRVKYVEFSGNNGEYVVGRFKFNYAKEEFSLVVQLPYSSTIDALPSSLSYVSAPGEPGYIALAPDLELSGGFTVKAYDKDGNTVYACRSDKPFKTEKGLIVDLGVLEDRLSSYALWQAGEDFEMGGVKYNKSEYGAATLVSDGGILGEKGVYFIDGEVSAKITATDTLIVVGNGKNAKLTISPSFLMRAKTLVLKNLEIETASDNKLLNINQMDRVVIDGCKLTLKNALADMSGSFSIENLVLTDNDFIIDPSLSEENAGLFTTGDATDDSSSLEEYVIRNNVFWSSTPREWHIIKSNPGNGLYIKSLDLSGNTFYNVYSGTFGDSLPKAFLMLGKLTKSSTFGANLVYTGSVLSSGQTPEASSPTAYLAGFYRDYTFESTQTLLESGATTPWYGTSALLGGEAFYTGRVYVTGTADTGIGEDFQMQYVRKNMTTLTEDPFTGIDPTTGTYSLKAAYSGLGATRN